MASYESDGDFADLIHSLEVELKSDDYRAVELAARAHYVLQSRTLSAQVRAYEAALQLHRTDARA